jgi:hypothetical protein
MTTVEREGQRSKWGHVRKMHLRDPGYPQSFLPVCTKPKNGQVFPVTDIAQDVTCAACRSWVAWYNGAPR